MRALFACGVETLELDDEEDAASVWMLALSMASIMSGWNRGRPGVWKLRKILLMTKSAKTNQQRGTVRDAEVRDLVANALEAHDAIHGPELECCF